MSDACDCDPVLWCEFDSAVERALEARLRLVAARLRVPPDGPLVPEAEVYVRTVLARAFDEELEER